jgi:secreted PhoX family phosphatase
MTHSVSDPSGSRRSFLRQALLAGGTAGLGMAPLTRLFARAMASTAVSGYGPLRPVLDESTGLPLLALPEGFRYRSFGWAGEVLADGTACPARHDGMGVVAASGSIVTLVRNHEQTGLDGAFGPPASHYDPACSGGTTTLRYDLASGKLVDAWPSLSGTMQNCAGGVTPWNSWLSCEEFVSSAGSDDAKSKGRFTRDHGFVFEVPAQGHSEARALRDLGQFRHEAAVVHAPSGDLYLTEDLQPSAGFYRFVPNRPGSLAAGGRLYMLRVKARPDLRHDLPVGERMQVDWVPIEHPERGHDAATGSISGVHDQGIAQRASRFTRLEGCIATDDAIYFTATDGGQDSSGQVFCFHPHSQEISLVFQSLPEAMLHYPDNVCLSPRGGLLICQDSPLRDQHLYGLTPAGGLFRFARNNVVLDGHAGFQGDFRSAEWAGACFSPDGQWLFANIYTPGFTVAITGPWQDGLV